MRISKYCIVCNKQFSVWPSHDRIKCCSVKCSNISKRGRHLSAQHRKKLSIVAKQKGFGLWMVGKKPSKETRLKQRKAHLGKKYKPMSDKGKYNLSIAHRKPTYKPFAKCNRRPIIYGYQYIKTHTHPSRTKNNYICEHRLNAEKLLGRYLKKTEIVHHINGNKLDNRPDNLMVFKNQAAHIRWHVIQKGLEKDDIVYPLQIHPLKSSKIV